MADYYKAGQNVSSANDVMDKLLAFLTAAGPGPAWVEDATWTHGANPTDLFLRTSGAIPVDVFFQQTSVDTETVLQCFWVPNPGGNYGAATGPAFHFTVRGAFFYLDTVNYDYVLFQFASEDRAVVVMQGLLKAGATLTAGLDDRTYQTMYFGNYTRHCDVGDDTYPLVIAGNGLYSLAASDATKQQGYFPEVIAKAVGPNSLRFADSVNRGWRPKYDVRFTPPRNSRGTEAFGFPQDVYVDYPGAEESFGLTGLYLTTRDVGLENDVILGGVTYFTVPALLNVTPNPDIQGGYGAFLMVPKGTVVP